MHRHTRLILALSAATLLATGGLLLLLRHPGALRGPAAWVPPRVDAAVPQDAAPGSGIGAGKDTGTGTGTAVDPDAAVRRMFTSPQEGARPPSAGERTGASGAAELARPNAGLQLPFEQGVVVPGGLSQQGSDALLQAEEFVPRMAEAAAQSGRDPDAADMTRVYRAAIERSLRESGGRTRLDGLACGTQLCVGLLAGGGEDDYRAWAETFAKRGGAPVYSMNTHVIAEAGDAPTLRFAFIVDPAFGGVVVDRL